MSFEEKLTNEGLGKERFESQFDLVNHAIQIAEDMIATGRDPYVKTESRSRATQILAEISADKDLIIKESEEELENPAPVNSSQERDVPAVKSEEKALVE